MADNHKLKCPFQTRDCYSELQLMFVRMISSESRFDKVLLSFFPLGARKESYVTTFCNQTWCCDTSCKTSGAVLVVKVTVLGGYKDIYLPVTLKCGLEFVFVALHS